jgi:predicted acylesterase/phospholipase RssA
MKLSKEVFNHDRVIFKVLPTGEEGCRFDASVLEQIIQKLVKDKLGSETATMAEIAGSDNDKPCRTFVVATSTAVAQGPPILFRSYNTNDNNANKCTIWQAMRATSAAPSFFDPVYIEIPAPGGWYVDGGLSHNNPSQLALDEAKRIWPLVKRFCAVSIGTGRQANVEFLNIKDVQPPREKSKGVIDRMLSKVPVIRTVKNMPSGGKELINIGKACIEMTTSSVLVHEAMVRAANAIDPQSRFPYYRFNVESGMDTIAIEEWKAIVRIGELTEQYMQEEGRKIEKMACIQSLISPTCVECT